MLTEGNRDIPFLGTRGNRNIPFLDAEEEPCPKNENVSAGSQRQLKSLCCRALTYTDVSISAIDTGDWRLDLWM